MKKLLAVLLSVCLLLCVTACFEATGNVSKMLAQAENLLDDKDWDDALELFLEIIERDPDYAEAYIGAAKAYIGKNRIDRAISILEKGHKATGDSKIKRMLDDLIEERDGVSEPEEVTTPPETSPPQTTAEPLINEPARTRIDIYTFTEETADILRFALEKAYPDFNDRFYLNYIFEGDDDAYIVKVENALESNNPPHIYIADVYWARRFAVNSNTASVSDFGVSYNANELYQYTIDLMTINGEVKGLSHQAVPGVIFYRSDLAKNIGFNDFNAVQAKMSTWDGFIDMAKELKKQDVYMVYSYDEIVRPFLNARDSGWINENGQLYIDEAVIQEFFNVSKQLYDIGAFAYNGTGKWSDGWWDGMSGQASGYYNDDVFAYFGVTWFLHYCLKPNSVYDDSSWWFYDDLIDSGYSDADIAAMNIGTFGDWGMVTPPSGYGYYWGGTYWFGSKAAAQDPDVCEGVRMILEMLVTNKEVMKAYNIETGDFSVIKSVVQEMGQDDTFGNPFLGGQNHYEAFVKAADTINGTNDSIYERDFDALFDYAIYVYFMAVEAGARSDVAYNAAMYSFVREVQAGYPDIDVSNYINKFI